MDITDIRRHYAEEIRAITNIHSESLINAFAKVPREHFLGKGPWQIVIPDMIMGTFSTRMTEDADPRHLYHNTPITIDPSRNLNNGQPGGLAFWIDNLELREGDHVIHVGCGVGYYTAIIAEIVGPHGKVTAIDIDAELASRARGNLSYLSQVQVLCCDGTKYELKGTDAVFINAGATHPKAVWLDSLKTGGRLILPLTSSKNPNDIGWGFIMKVKREAEKYAASSIGPTGIYPCLGARDEEINNKLQGLFAARAWMNLKSLRRDSHEADSTCLLHGSDFCLSSLPL